MLATLAPIMKGMFAPLSEASASYETTVSGPPRAAQAPGASRWPNRLFELMKRRSVPEAQPRIEVFTVTADLVRIEGALLIAEFETPCDEFFLPRRAALVSLSTSGVVGRVVDEAASSPAGPHAKGLRVRLAFRLPSGSWPHGVELEIDVLGLLRRVRGSMGPASLVLRVALPRRLPEPAGS